jgi:hypothetical protein
MIEQWKNWSYEFVFFAALAVIAFIGCKKEDSPTESAVDPALFGVWYSNDYGVGFEVLDDGSSKTLIVDTAGRLQYNPPGAEVNSSLILTILKAKDGNLTSILRYKQPGTDTTETLPGTYILSDTHDKLTVTTPNPLNSTQQITVVFIRSAIGAIVRPKS